VDPCPAARCDVEPILRHFTSPHADEVEVAGVREAARRVGDVRDGNGYGHDRELLGMFAVTGCTRVEILVPLRRDLRPAGVKIAVEGASVNRLPEKV